MGGMPLPVNASILLGAKSCNQKEKVIEWILLSAAQARLEAVQRTEQVN